MRKSLLLCAGIAASIAAPAYAADQYPINFPLDQVIPLNERSLQGVKLTSPADGTQQIYINQEKDAKLYRDATDKCFTAGVGEALLPSFNWTGSWMHGYVYLDRGNDGQFDYKLTAMPQGDIVEMGDIMAYSNYNGYNSAGANTANGNVGVDTPAFTLPADLQPGLYRMRYKVDWQYIDPAGRPGDVETANSILKNRGAIADVMLYVHPAESGFDIKAEHATVTDANGNPLTADMVTTGQPIELMVAPDAGYYVSKVTIESGYKFENSDLDFANPDVVYKKVELPSTAIVDNIFTIPGSSTYGKIVLTVEMAEGSDPTLNYYTCALEGTKNAAEGITGVNVNGELKVSTDQRHFFQEKNELAAEIGKAFTPAVTYTGTASKVNFYIDLGQTGQFAASDIVASGAPASLAAVTIPAETKPGVYRARMEAEGDCAVDFLLNVHSDKAAIRVQLLNGTLTGANGAPVPLYATFGQELTLTPAATLPGFVAEKVTVRHGQNVTGRQYIRGNRQWDEIEIPAGESTTLNASEVNGMVLVSGEFAETESGDWTLVWSDEFDSPEMNPSNWSYHGRMGSVWNRFCALGDEREVVNKFDDGMYSAYAIKTPEEFKDIEDKEMISGAIYTAGKFYMQGGYVEARCKTLPHKGNFQAFWLMPVDQSAGWPACGEIDIWEQIDEQKVACATLHHAWKYAKNSEYSQQFRAMYGQISQTCPYGGGTKDGVDAALWHTYAFEWDEDNLKWYIDGQLIAHAENPHYSQNKWTEAVTWPWNKPYYVICNQSVGNGSWAAAPDLNFEYRTDFDYVRAYQKKGNLNYYSSADGQVSGIDNVITDTATGDDNAPVEYFNLQGISVGSNPVPGVYIRRQGSKSEKIIIR
ncbi:MAG: glycoside hydrolase family 16 protein [[Clostridium] fimetarium]|nr:glycoside hydrolase family 16 protein [Alistipes timonensis]MCM1404941.1 glycoside hydrolase family 16 protein [[Clostridium] fimetarium]